MKPTFTIFILCLSFSLTLANPISADNIEQLNQQRNDYNLHHELLQDSSYLLDNTTNTKSQESTNNKDATNTQDNKHDSTMQSVPQTNTQHTAVPAKELPCFIIDYIALSLPPPSTSILRQKVSKEFAFLQPILTSYQHKCLNTNDIATLLNALRIKAIKKGYATTSFALTPQNLNSKKLLITLQTSTICDIIIDKPKYARFLRKDYPIKIGDFVNIAKIEQGLHNYKRLRSISPTIALQPYLADFSLDSSPPTSQKSRLDSNFDSTQITHIPKTTQSTQNQSYQIPQTKIYLNHHIKTLSKKGKLAKISTPFYASLSIDNAGSNATNIYQTSLQLGLENLAGLAEKLSAYFVSTPLWDKKKHSIYTSLDISIPFRRVLFSASGSYASYAQTLHIAQNEFIYNGYSANMDLKAQILLFMDSLNHLKLHIGLGKRWTKNYLEKIEIITQRRNLSNVYTSVHYTRYVKNAYFDISVGLKQGIKAFGAMDNFAPPSSATNPTNTATPNFFYTIPTIDVFAYMPFRLKNQQFLHTSFIKTQVSRTQLYASEKFSLGGIYSVRGFDSLVLNGEVGVLCRNDFSYYIKPIKSLRFIPSFALDIGYSTNIYDKLDSSLKGNNTLMGGGMGLKLHISRYFNAEVWGYMPLYNPKNLDKRYFYFSIGAVF